MIEKSSHVPLYARHSFQGGEMSSEHYQREIFIHKRLIEYLSRALIIPRSFKFRLLRSCKG